MNGFMAQRLRYCVGIPYDPQCVVGGRSDVMGYHTAAEIPNYWAYAKNFVLTDQMFQPVKSWSLAADLYMASAWSAMPTAPL